MSFVYAVNDAMKAHREMILAGYVVYRFGGKELWVNDHTSEDIIIRNISLFFDKLFEKNYIDK